MPESERRDVLVWTCDECKQPIADGDGYVHVADLEAVASERQWADHEFQTETRVRAGDDSALYVSLGELQDITPPTIRWHAHHASCDPDPDHSCYWFDVDRARTHAHLLSWSGHFIETKSWIRFTDWHDLIRRKAGVDA